MSNRLFIHAPNIRAGGGRTLLLAMFESLPDDVEVFLSVDARLDLPEKSGGPRSIKRVAPTLSGRIAAELWLAKSATRGDLVLSFGNLPPLLGLKAKVVVYLQNRYLIDAVGLEGFSIKARLRLMLERIWFSWRLAAVNEVVVQTPSMKRLLQQRNSRVERITIFPFAGAWQNGQAGSGSAKKGQPTFDFVYVASGEPHKNHRNLVKAWSLLAQEGIRPLLLLTFDKTKFPGLWEWIISESDNHDLKIQNIGGIDEGDIDEIYAQAGALVFPSRLESLGLPLIEARNYGLPVLASELDYVRDVLDPEQTFDPDSAISIARAVKRHLGISQQPLPLQSAESFVAYLLDENKVRRSPETDA